MQIRRNYLLWLQRKPFQPRKRSLEETGIKTFESRLQETNRQNFLQLSVANKKSPAVGVGDFLNYSVIISFTGNAKQLIAALTRKPISEP